jgi:hypothetical protein
MLASARKGEGRKHYAYSIDPKHHQPQMDRDLMLREQICLWVLTAIQRGSFPFFFFFRRLNHLFQVTFPSGEKNFWNPCLDKCQYLISRINTSAMESSFVQHEIYLEIEYYTSTEIKIRHIPAITVCISLLSVCDKRHTSRRFSSVSCAAPVLST